MLAVLVGTRVPDSEGVLVHDRDLLGPHRPLRDFLPAVAKFEKVRKFRAIGNFHEN